MELGYARVSTTHQDLTRQIKALSDAGIPDDRVFVDKRTGSTTARPGYQAMLDYARPGDVLVAHELSRFGRNTRDVLNMIHDLEHRSIGIRTLADPIPIDTTNPKNPMAKLAVVLLSIFAEMERTYAIERAAHAREVARAQGRQVGRPSKVDPDDLKYATYLRDVEKLTMEQISAKVGIPRTTLYRHLPKRRPERASTEAVLASEM